MGFRRATRACPKGRAEGEGDAKSTEAAVDSTQNTTVELLLAEFNEGLRCEGRADFTLLDRCPRAQRKELLALLNVAALAYLALAPEREEHRRSQRSRRAG